MRWTSFTATVTNATTLTFCFCLIVNEIIKPVKDALVDLDCCVLFFKYLSWLFRRGTYLLHQASLSLTLNELLGMRDFVKHIQTCLPSREFYLFGDVENRQVQEDCKKKKINVDSMRYFIPFVTMIWDNTKGRLKIPVLNSDAVREPLGTEWITADMTVDEILQQLGSWETANVEMFSLAAKVAIQDFEMNNRKVCHTIFDAIF